MADSGICDYAISGGMVRFIFGDGDDPMTIEDVDAEVFLPDGSRWSASCMTLPQIERVLIRWSQTGENASGAYLRCPDLLIVAKPGVAGMLIAIEDLLGRGMVSMLGPLPAEEDL